MLVLPAVLVAGPTGHDRAAGLAAALGHGTVDEVDAVEEVHHMYGDPVVDVLARWQPHHTAQVQTRLERRLRLLIQLKALCARLEALPRPERLVFGEHLLQAQCHGRDRPRARGPGAGPEDALPGPRAWGSMVVRSLPNGLDFPTHHFPPTSRLLAWNSLPGI